VTKRGDPGLHGHNQESSGISVLGGLFQETQDLDIRYS
jgi:hypothetical protein